MKWFPTDEQDKKTVNLLKASKQDFKFDEQNVRARLFMAIGTTLPDSETKKAHRLLFFPKYMAGLVTSLIIVGGMAGVAVASNKAKPGEKLYKVQTLQNNIVLSLPLPDTQKAEYRTDIVAQRLDDLNTLQAASTTDPHKLQAEVQASSQSISDAVDNLKNIQKQAKSNNSKILSLVKQLDDLSNQHEQRMESLKNSVTDEKLRAEIEQSLQTIKASRAQLLQDEQGGSSSGSQIQNLIPSKKNK